MTRKLPLFFFLIVAMHLALVGCKSAPVMVQPEGIDISGMDKSKVESAIRAALDSRGFIYEGQKNQVIKTTWNKGRHSATWGIDYSGDEVVIEYVNSTELSYYEEGGQQYIHRTYNSWTNTLRADISREIGKLRD